MSLLTANHLEAEKAIVQTCLEYPDRMANAHVLPEHFASPMYRTAWRVMQERELASAPISSVIVADFMREAGINIAGSDLLGSGAAGSCAVVEVLGSQILEAHVSRSVAFHCSEVVQAIKDGQRGSEALSEALRGLSAIDTGQRMEAITAPQLIADEFAELQERTEARKRGEDAALGIPTGLEELDEKLGGLQWGVCTAVAGRPGMGKSSFAIAVVDGATAAGHGAHVFTPEDTCKTYRQRLLARICKVPVEAIKQARFNRGQFDDIERNAHNLKDRKNWLVDDRSGLTAEEIVRSVRRLKKQNKTELVIVDYLQLLKSSIRAPTHEQLGQSMQVFADAAKQDNMSYLVLSQLNRGVEMRDDKRPQCSDLKGSGDIEDKSKCILFLYRGEVYGDRDSNPSKVEILIGKNNQGESGVRVEANWDGPTIRMY